MQLKKKYKWSRAYAQVERKRISVPEGRRQYMLHCCSRGHFSGTFFCEIIEYIFWVRSFQTTVTLIVVKRQIFLHFSELFCSI